MGHTLEYFSEELVDLRRQTVGHAATTRSDYIAETRQPGSSGRADG